VLDELRNRDQFLADSLTNLLKQFNELAKQINTVLELDAATAHDDEGNEIPMCVSLVIEKLKERVDDLTHYYITSAEQEQAEKEHMQYLKRLQGRASQIAESTMQPIEQHFADASKMIDWEQKRYEIAKAIYTSDPAYVAQPGAAEESVYYADKLIDELKKQSE
jgi:ElaB/YqjD/DUF883 family membrane-anchored ribosome-binding protein